MQFCSQGPGNKLNMRQHCALPLPAKKAKHILGWISKRIASREVILPLSSAFITTQSAESRLGFPSIRKTSTSWGEFRGEARECLGAWTTWRTKRGWWKCICSLCRRGCFRTGRIAIYSYLPGWYRESKASLFSGVCGLRTRWIPG